MLSECLASSFAGCLTDSPSNLRSFTSLSRCLIACGAGNIFGALGGWRSHCVLGERAGKDVLLLPQMSAAASLCAECLFWLALRCASAVRCGVRMNRCGLPLAEHSWRAARCVCLCRRGFLSTFWAWCVRVFVGCALTTDMSLRTLCSCCCAVVGRDAGLRRALPQGQRQGVRGHVSVSQAPSPGTWQHILHAFHS